MAIGLGLGMATYTFSTAKGYWRWVKRCDEAGVDSLWQTDRLVSKEPFLECLTVMAGLAGATKKIKFGMNVASLGLRDPLMTAKQCATIDYLSDGRLLPAFGLGSNRSRDWVASGTATKARGQRMNEALEIMTRLWLGEEVTFSGKHFQYDKAYISPGPVQKPLPLWIGGSSEAAIERSGKYGTGWQAAFDTPEEAGVVVEKILQSAKRNNRPMDKDHFSAAFGVRFGSWNDEPVKKMADDFEKRTGKEASRGIVVGTGDQILERIQSYVDNGISKFILRPIGLGDEEMFEQTEQIIENVLNKSDQLVEG
ncbi:MAG: LLM class flavin-dependent oxidoreductase [Pseudomonadota bacterium]|nr:LLM class flavin-dependent oxidoreductase [Pseudomonadota bacterium]MEC9100556.1 LLM class flavin-dependent oxidoreductase [Pseudomonadota bacterium]MED5473654.1 LLM class flavin-dependent oxidoreductase [Pseudomonadota bacterium]